MPANASGNPSADLSVGLKQHEVTLLVDVQVADELSPVTSELGLPEQANFEHWALHAFACAHRLGWNADWLGRINSSADPLAAAKLIDESELCIRLVDAAESEALNAQWRDKKAPTNVLSFTADIVAGQYAPLGDLVLCAPVVAREAAEQGKSVAHHYAHLVVHGVLHLFGFDHLIEAEAEAMEAMEAAVLSELGIGNPYE